MIDIFGHTGFIGSRFCDLYSDEINKIPREEREIVSPEVLYFLSTNTNYNVYRDLHIDIDTNLNILMDVLSSGQDKKPIFNFISSWFVFGDVNLPAKETDHCSPKGFYSITKKCAEDLLVSYCKTFNIPYRILRLSNVYGSEDTKFSKEKNALQFLISKLKMNEDIGLYYGGEFTREYTHVDDICSAIKLIVDRAPVNEIYNVGCGEPYLFGNLIGHVKNRIESTSDIKNIEPSDFHKIVQVKDMYMDNSKLMSLGFLPNVNVYDGLNDLCDGV
jgi:nucleoside-diphosphate-sugar epimerase